MSTTDSIDIDIGVSQVMHAAAERAIHYACAQFNVGQFQSQRIDVQAATRQKMQVRSLHLSFLFIITRFSCRRQGASADKLHVKAAKFLPLVGLARSKQDLFNRGHGAQYLYRPPPAGALTAL